MNNLVPKSLLEELANTFATEEIKYDLKPFGEGSRLITRYRKGMNELMRSDPYEAYLGLGVLSAYENNYSLAIQYFEAAQKLNPASRSPSINIASCTLLNGQLDKCINILLETLNNFPNDQKIIRTLLRILIMFFYYDEIDELKEKNLSNTTFLEVLNEQRLYEDKDCRDNRKFLSSGLINVEVLREIKVLTNQVFFSNFTVNSSYVSHFESNEEDATFDEIVYIQPNLFGQNIENKDSIVFKMNETLQEKLVDLMLRYSSQDNSKSLLESFRKISIYFAVDTRLKKA